MSCQLGNILETVNFKYHSVISVKLYIFLITLHIVFYHLLGTNEDKTLNFFQDQRVPYRLYCFLQCNLTVYVPWN